MGREYERLFGALPKIEAPAYLCERVLVAVSRERIRLVRMRLVFSSCASFLSLAAIFTAGRMLVNAMHATGFSSYASLMLSDGGAVLGNGHAYLLTLAESLPGPETILTLLALAVLIQSLRVMISSGIEWVWARPMPA